VIAVFFAGIYTATKNLGISMSTSTWSDTFTGPAGSPPDASKWTAVQGSGVAPEGGGNNELQSYTPEALAMDGKGNLVFTAAYVNGAYTSGKIWTIGLVNFQYGHIAVNVAMPDVGKSGYWPGIWMLGSDYPSVGWPLCGEIDIAEAFGVNGLKNQIAGSVHTATDGPSTSYNFPAGKDATTFHTYSIDWRPTSVTFSVDGVNYATYYKSRMGTWPFDKPMFLILNLAVGGNMGGPPNPANLPYTMLVHSVTVNGSVVSP
jgi:beta-glucanase (GH16 family)